MKKISVLAVLAVALVFGLALAGCKSEPDESPEMTAVYVVKRADMDAGNYYNYVTAIAANERFMLRWIGKNPYEDLIKGAMTIKRGTEVINAQDLPFDSPITKGEGFLFNTGTYTLPAGTYTIEVYVVDAKGNKSNTVSVPLTVTQ
jgi:hypothetical protein